MPTPKKKPRVQVRRLPSQQSKKARPVIANPDLPMMEKRDKVKTVHRNPLLQLMGAGAVLRPQGQGLMPSVPPKSQTPPPDSGTPQQPREPLASADPNEGYVRVRMRLENRKLFAIGFQQVSGPLALPSAVIRGHVYEVLLNNQQIMLGSVPDIGVRRSFANRDVPGPEGKHHFTPLANFDFMVRIPKGRVSTENLPRLNIVLHQVSEAPDRLTTLAPLRMQPGVKTKEIGRLSGIRLEELPPSIRTQFQQVLREMDKLK